MRVRRATDRDVKAMAWVLAEVAEEGSIATEPPVDLDDQSRGMRETIRAGGPGAMWVVDDGGGVVGTAGLHPTPIPGVLAFGMAILERARGRGAGRALLEALVDHARTVGAHKVELEVWPDNDPAIALYSSAGFEREGLRRDHYRRRDGSLRSSVLMSLLLGD